MSDYLAEALKPFASAAGGLPAGYNGSIDLLCDSGNFGWLRASELRAASAALSRWQSERAAGDGEVEAIRAERDRAQLACQQIAERLSAAEARAEAAEARVGELEAALEWALDNADTEHPHYPVREGDIWVYMYLVHGSPMGGGVGTARFETALDAVSAAQTETRKP